MPRSGNLHEDFDRRLEIEGSSDRAFGVIVGALLVALAFAKIRLGSWHLALLAIGCALVILGLIRPSLLSPLNRAWIVLGVRLGLVTGFVVTALIFFVVITPTGLLLRAFGKDLLGLKVRANDSYWIARNQPAPDPQGMINQF